MKFEINDKQVELFYGDIENKKIPVIILNTYGDEGKEVWEECKKLNTIDFILVAISKIDWNNDMTPWKCPPLYKGDSSYNGDADKYLNVIINEIIPRIREIITNDFHKEIDYFGIAGYSLGGLFATYAGYKTDEFKRIVSASGSMWYSDFAKFVKENKISKNIDKVYFSLGNKEKNTKNIVLKTVEDKTKEIYESIGNINKIFEENEGNHFQDGALRTAKGIKWILE